MFHYGFLLVFPSPCVSSKYSCLFPRTIRNRPPTDGNVKLDPNYPRFRFFFRRGNFRSHRFFLRFFPLERPATRSSPSFAAPPNPITRSLLSRAQRNFRLTALIHFRYSFLRLSFRLPQERSSNVPRVSFSCPFPPRLSVLVLSARAVPHQLFSRSGGEKWSSGFSPWQKA